MYLALMLFAYLDEFGHVGPFVHRQDPKYKDSPVFGLAGIILPEPSIRPFSTKFLKLKENVFSADIQRAKKESHSWEKKGADIFRPKALTRYSSLRQVGFRLINAVNDCGGMVFYYGREKIIGNINVKPNGLYTTIFAKTIRKLNAYAESVDSNFAIVVDEHSARKELLECAAKTMFGKEPAKRLVSPPFEVESYLNQNIQAADWVASIVGKLWCYRILPEQFRDHEVVDRYFGGRISAISTHSTVDRRKIRQPTLVGLTSEPKKTLRYSISDRG